MSSLEQFGVVTIFLKLPTATVITTHPSLSYLKNVLTTDMISFFNSTANMTLFLPVDTAWEALPPFERLYLESKYATDDLTRIVNMHAVSSKTVRYSESFKSGADCESSTLLPLTRTKLQTVTTVHGRKLKIKYSDKTKNFTVSESTLVEQDVYASNGVIHTVDSLLVPPGTIQLTPEKYLLVLNCTSFVSLLHSVNLTSFINDTETDWTILAPKDDVIALFQGDGSELPAPGSEELKRLLQYHFIPGKKRPEKLVDRVLLETALEEEGLDGGRQVVSVDVSESHGKDKGKSSDRNIRFGGAGAIGEPGKFYAFSFAATLTVTQSRSTTLLSISSLIHSSHRKILSPLHRHP